MLAGVGRIGRIGGAGSGSAAGLTGFVSVWATTGALETITIPTQNIGTFNAGVDWGDGTIETITTYNGFSHEYAAIGDHTISITGTFPNIYFNNGGDKLKIKKVLNLGAVGWTRLNNAFFGCTNLTEFTAGSTDTANTSTMQTMFLNCSGLTSLDVSTFDTSSVGNISYMFQGCSGLTSLDLSAFDTSSVGNMTQVFLSCSGLTSLDLSAFDTSSVATMLRMFNNCNALTSLVGAEDFIITGLNSTGSLTDFLTGGKMTTPQYDNLLVKWRAQDPFNGMTPSFGASTYTGGGAAATARQDLIDIDGWSISDGGIA